MTQVCSVIFVEDGDTIPTCVFEKCPVITFTESNRFLKRMYIWMYCAFRADNRTGERKRDTPYVVFLQVYFMIENCPPV